MSETHRDSKKMLMDDYMGGFLWQIVEHKWFLWARTSHLVTICPELVRLVLMTYVACPTVMVGIPDEVELKSWVAVDYVEQQAGAGVTIAAIAVTGLVLVRDLWESKLWIKSRRYTAAWMSVFSCDLRVG